MRLRCTGRDRRGRSPTRTVALAAILACGSPGLAADPLAVSFDGGRLTVHADGVSRDELLAAVARETGMAIDGAALDARVVSKHFDALPLDEALDRLVGRQNFVVRYGANGAPERIQLLGMPSPPPGTATERAADAIRLLVAQPPVALPPAAAKALGGARLPVAQVLAGFRHADPGVRDAAVQALVGVVEANPALLSAIRRLSAEQLAQFVSANAGPFSADVAGRLQRAARDPTLKTNLSATVAQLQRTVG